MATGIIRHHCPPVQPSIKKKTKDGPNYGTKNHIMGIKTEKNYENQDHLSNISYELYWLKFAGGPYSSIFTVRDLLTYPHSHIA
jgi:hypothetical protein